MNLSPYNFPNERKTTEMDIKREKQKDPPCKKLKCINEKKNLQNREKEDFSTRKPEEGADILLGSSWKRIKIPN